MKNFLVSVLCFCITVILFIGRCSGAQPAYKPAAVKGVIDLSQWNFQKYGELELDGEWTFYWNQFLNYETILQEKPPVSSYLNVPGHWRDMKLGDSVLPGSGYCTIHLLVKLPALSKDLSIRIPDIGTAHKIWINEKLIYEAGKVGKSEKEMIPYLMPEIRPLNSQLEKEFHITMQISNFMDRTGGVWGHLTLGSFDQLYRQRSIVLSSEMTVFGGLFIMAIYHLGLFTIRRQDRSTLFFGLFCMDFAFRTLLAGQRNLMYFFPALPFEFTFRAEYLAGYLAFPFVVSFLYYVFSGQINRTYLKIVWGFVLLLCISALIFPHYKYTQALVFYEIFVLCSLPYLLFANVSAIRNKKIGSLSSFAGHIILCIGAVTDTLHNEHIIFLPYIFPFCLFGFLFFQSFSLSMKFSKAFSVSEKQSLELIEKTMSLTSTNEELNALKTELEEKVEERSRTLKRVYQESVKEMQKVNSLEKELAVQKERQKIFVDIHDHMGSNILDLKKYIDDIDKKSDNHQDIIRSARYTLKKLEDNLRMKLYAIEDLEFLQKDPLNGIRLLILRRYSAYSREINFFCEESLYEVPKEHFSDSMVEVLFSVSQENASNDLKYGVDLSEWKFFRRKKCLCLEILSSTMYPAEQRGSGNGRRNIERRINEIGGYSVYCEESDKFHARFYLPFFE